MCYLHYQLDAVSSITQAQSGKLCLTHVYSNNKQDEIHSGLDLSCATACSQPFCGLWTSNHLPSHHRATVKSLVRCHNFSHLAMLQPEHTIVGRATSLTSVVLVQCGLQQPTTW